MDGNFVKGKLLPINQNQALFSLLGTTMHGGNWITLQRRNARRNPRALREHLAMTLY
ncbi:tail fiber protein [Paenibacillus sp. J2TS4]|uniref:tail fiber protein n=1 Tax=Paenibacillus sp. J2TS4 TaxID=2807194 RepID=UPI0035B51F1D